MKIIALLILLYSIFASAQLIDIESDQALLFSKVNAITQDESGYLWIASINGIYKYNGYEFQSLMNCDFKESQNISQLTAIPLNTILFVRNKRNLYTYSNEQCKKLELPKQIIINDIYKDRNKKIWIATNMGIYYLSEKYDKLVKFSNQNFPNRATNTIILDKFNNIVLTNKGGLFIFDKKSNKTYSYIIPDSSVVRIYDLKINHNMLYIATNTNIFQFDLATKTFNSQPLLLDNVRVPAIIIENNRLWAATGGMGLFKINLESNHTTQYSKSKYNNKSLKEDSIVSLYMTKDHTIFLGGFFKGLSQMNLAKLQFQYNSASCLKGSPIFTGIIDKSSNLWVGSRKNIYKIDFNSKKCQQITISDNKPNTSISSLIRIDKQIWFTNNNELYTLDVNTQAIKKIHKYSKFLMGVVFDKSKNLLYMHSRTSLHIYNLKTQQSHSIKFESNTSIKITDFALHDSKILLATNQGLFQLNPNNKLIPLENRGLLQQNISAISLYNNSIYVAIIDRGIYKVVDNAIQLVLSSDKFPNNSVVNKIIKTNQLYWFSSDKGLIKYDSSTKASHIFQYRDGLYNNYFYKNFSFLTSYDQIYFGGKNGFVNFNPNEIFINEISPQIVLEHLYIQDKKVDLYTTQPSGFKINKPINELNEISLSHNDYIVGFEFAALDYADPMRNQYAYRLKGFQEDWVSTDAKNRKATYTNLSPGEYIFQVKGSNKDGVWSKKPKELKIIVHPAPWFSPWAYALYAFIFLFSIWCFIRYKTIASRKHSIFLEQKVEERTQEVNQQKKMVESLLEHKNEIFANITHEFKTPLALILGPAEQLANHKELIQHTAELNMIERNAKRLMVMVAQILKLSQAENDKEVIRESQAVQPILLMLYEAFTPLANRKNIDLQLDNTNDVNVYATTECLEVVVSNLLTNALKYTNEGGKVIVKSIHVNNQVSISVNDSGSGIKEQDQTKIFKRFTRLENHRNIAGTGIGLSVVKEITEANDGHVSIDSQWGQGSTFTVTFPITDIKAHEEMSEVMVDQLVKNTENELVQIQRKPQAKRLKNRVTVLIIEDNLDMQSHIENVLGHRFNCLFADRGREGIASALKQLPDIVICDVMMPGMDGYQVTRILRHDGRTSHIPIILLTALNTTQSRIKGWRENIDTYMTKPFNAGELNAQIDNILTIRKILQKQTNQAIRKNSTLDSLNLSKQDEKFVDKFKDVIGKYYGNEYFQKADLASKMAISERQLQRKLKALIDQNPMEMLRDYRLEKAAMKLKDGYQVGIVSDECGFSSVSYFGSCFKKKYGITPKAYQTLRKA